MTMSARLPEAWNGCPRCRGIRAHDRVEQAPIFRGIRSRAQEDRSNTRGRWCEAAPPRPGNKPAQGRSRTAPRDCQPGTRHPGAGCPLPPRTPPADRPGPEARSLGRRPTAPGPWLAAPFFPSDSPAERHGPGTGGVGLLSTAPEADRSACVDHFAGNGWPKERRSASAAVGMIPTASETDRTKRVSRIMGGG